MREQKEWSTKEQKLIKEKEALRSELEVASRVLQNSRGREGKKGEGRDAVWLGAGIVMVEYTTMAGLVRGGGGFYIVLYS